jgi:hypothetical protein
MRNILGADSRSLRDKQWEGWMDGRALLMNVVVYVLTNAYKLNIKMEK